MKDLFVQSLKVSIAVLEAVAPGLTGSRKHMAEVTARAQRDVLKQIAATKSTTIEVAKVQELAERWEELAKRHGVRDFTGNDHLLFANELRAFIDANKGK